jgi:glycyl-tRNA synthetase beta chain
VIDAVLEARNPLTDLRDAWERIELVKELTQQPETLKLLYEPANRIFKILGDAYRSEVTFSDIDPAHFQDPSENALLESLQGLPNTQDYSELLKALLTLSNPIETFFNQVLVNDADPQIRQNRYNLLSYLNRLYLRLACFSRLVIQ